MIVLIASLLAALGAGVLGARFAEGSAGVLYEAAGPITTYGIPTASVIASTAMAVTMGGSILAGWILPASARPEAAAELTAARRRVLTIITGAAVVWTLVGIAQFLMSYSLAAGQAVGSDRFGSDMAVFASSSLGIWRIAALILTAAASTIAVSGTSRRTARAASVAVFGAVLCAAMTSHAAGGATHDAATSAMLFHLVAMAAWLGPLALLMLLRIQSAQLRAQIIERFSATALVAWLMMAVSGLVSLGLRLDSIDQLWTQPYAILGLGKIVALVLVGILGWGQRRLIAQRRGGFADLAAVEAGIGMAALGLGAAMSSSPPPVADVVVAPGPAGQLTGFALPPGTLSGALTAWRPDVFAILLAALLIGVWQWARLPHARAVTVILAGYALLQSSPIAVYGRIMMSMHLLRLLLLVAAVGLPIGLLLWKRLRAAPAGGPLARVADEFSRRGVRWAASLSPVLLLAGVLHTPALLHAELSTTIGALTLSLMVIAAGALWGVAIGAGGPQCVLVGAAGLGVWLGLLGASQSVLAPSWFGATGRTYAADALRDQSSAALLLAAVAALMVILSGVQMVRTRRAPGPVRAAAAHDA